MSLLVLDGAFTASSECAQLDQKCTSNMIGETQPYIP